MAHSLLGRKQTAEHIAKRMDSYPKKRKLQELEKKLLAKIDKQAKGCWVWVGSRFKKEYGDYGQIRVGYNGGKLKRAHRVVYEFYRGEIPQGLELDHLCHNTLCVNPDHLEPVLHHTNTKRRKDSGLLYCKYGHKYTDETTYIRPDNGRRECKTCRFIRRVKQ